MVGAKVAQKGIALEWKMAVRTVCVLVERKDASLDVLLAGW